jgi:hypothetical protein
VTLQIDTGIAYSLETYLGDRCTHDAPRSSDCVA